VPSLFGDSDEYLTEGVRLTFGDPRAIAWETDGPVLSLKPPEDLLRRLSALPQSYLKQRQLGERLRLTTDAVTANQSLNDAIGQRVSAGDSGTAWPEIHHLGPQHPVLEWIADKVLYRVGRNEALAIACDVPDPALLVSGVWSNMLGEPIASSWLAATVEDGLVTFEDLHGALRAAGVHATMVNPGWPGDAEELRRLVPHVVREATSRLADDLRAPLAAVTERLETANRRLRSWQVGARQVAASMKSEPHRRGRLEYIDRVSRQMSALIADHTPAGAPLVRIVGALVPRQTVGQ
jgi:hypothetical protein